MTEMWAWWRGEWCFFSQWHTLTKQWNYLRRIFTEKEFSSQRRGKRFCSVSTGMATMVSAAKESFTWITKKQSLADRNLRTEIEGYASLWNNAVIITGKKKHKKSQSGEFCVEVISHVHFTFKHYHLIGSHVKTITTLSLVSLTAVVNVVTQRHLKQLQGRLLDSRSSFTLKSNNNFN